MTRSKRIQKSVGALLASSLLVALFFIASDQARSQSPQSPQSPQSTQPQQPAAQQPNNQPPQKNPIIARLEQQIAGQEKKPAEEVFKNIQIFKGMEAGRVLRIMEFAFGPALGVNCSHCHVFGEWEKDDKAPKDIARKMWLFTPKVNQELKAAIGKGMVNCYTCHRGQTKPALNPAPATAK